MHARVSRSQNESNRPSIHTETTRTISSWKSDFTHQQYHWGASLVKTEYLVYFYNYAISIIYTVTPFVELLLHATFKQTSVPNPAENTIPSHCDITHWLVQSQSSKLSILAITILMF